MRSSPSSPESFSISQVAGNYFLALECYFHFSEDPLLKEMDFEQMTIFLKSKEPITKLVEPVFSLFQSNDRAKLSLIKEALCLRLRYGKNTALRLHCQRFFH